MLSGLAHAVCKLEVAAKSSGLQQLTEHMKLNQTAPKGDHVGFKGESSWWPKQVLLVASLLWAADGPYSISFSKSFLANRDNPSFDVCSLGYRCSQQALQFVFILAKPCLFLSRFDCYSEGWDSSFSQSAYFQGANNERLSVWRHKGKGRSPSSSSKQSASARPHTLLFSVFDMQLGDLSLLP